MLSLTSRRQLLATAVKKNTQKQISNFSSGFNFQFPFSNFLILFSDFFNLLQIFCPDCSLQLGENKEEIEGLSLG